MNETPTPRTDAIADHARNMLLDYDCQGESDNIPTPIVVPADFARTLERELAAVTEERDSLWADGVHTCGPNCKRVACVLRRELAAMTDQRDTLVTALEKIEERFTDGEDTHDDWQFMGTTAQQALTPIRP